MSEQIKDPTIYYTVRNNEIQRSVKEKTATSVEVTKDGVTSHFERITSISGKLWQLFISESESKAGGKYKTLSITLNDGKTKRSLQMFFDSNEATSFFRRLKNIDLTKSIRIFVRKTESESGYIGARVDVYYENADGSISDVIPNYFTETNPLPKWVETTVNQKKVFDKTECLNLFEKIAEETNIALSGKAAEAEVLKMNSPLEDEKKA